MTKAHYSTLVKVGSVFWVYRRVRRALGQV